MQSVVSRANVLTASGPRCRAPDQCLQLRAPGPPCLAKQLQRAALSSSAARRRGSQRAAASSDVSGVQEPMPQPEDARGAIAVGLRIFERGDNAGALEMFNKALSLPGTGALGACLAIMPARRRTPGGTGAPGAWPLLVYLSHLSI